MSAKFCKICHLHGFKDFFKFSNSSSYAKILESQVLQSGTRRLPYSKLFSSYTIVWNLLIKFVLWTSPKEKKQQIFVNICQFLYIFCASIIAKTTLKEKVILLQRQRIKKQEKYRKYTKVKVKSEILKINSQKNIEKWFSLSLQKCYQFENMNSQDRWNKSYVSNFFQ